MNLIPGAWRATPGPIFEWRHYGDESVLFDPRSGLTHFLSAVAADAIELLKHADLTTAQLNTALLERCDVVDADAFARQLDLLLQQLGDLELIQSVSDQC
jgi:PqqD family protein of HPr-rel-A system